MFINQLEKVFICNSEQWILTRSRQENAPLLLHVQAGPGLPMISEANTMQKKLGLEDEYCVVYWEQRGCGKSFDSKASPALLNFEQLVKDLIACVEQLLQKHQQPALAVVGYSIGATLALMAAQQAPALFNKVFVVGMDIDLPTANQAVQEFILEKAHQTGKKRLIQQAQSLQKPINTPALFQLRARLLTDLGGMIKNGNYQKMLFDTVRHILFSKYYGFLGLRQVLKGMAYCQEALLPYLNACNLFEKVKCVGVPVHFIQGRYDALAPLPITEKYYDFLDAPQKEWTIFENSAHLPHLEEPEKFAYILKANTHHKK